jgi:hypothetical protein
VTDRVTAVLLSRDTDLYNLTVKTSHGTAVMQQKRPPMTLVAYLSRTSTWRPSAGVIQNLLRMISARRNQSWVSEGLKSDGAVFKPNSLDDTFKVETGPGRPVGTNGQTGIRAIVSNDGRVINAFPFNP